MPITRRARSTSSSVSSARRSCSCSDTPAVVGETAKSRGATTPRSRRAASTTTRNSASASSSRISASVAESPSRTVGAGASQELAHRGAAGPPVDDQVPAQQGVADDAVPAVAELDHGARQVPVGPLPLGQPAGDLVRRVRRGDHQRFVGDQVVDQAVRRPLRAPTDGRRHVLGQEASTLGRGERGRRPRSRDGGHLGASGGHHPRADRALGEHRGEAEHLTGPETLVGHLQQAIPVVPDVDLALDDHEHLAVRVDERVDDQLAGREPLDPSGRRDGRDGRRVERGERLVLAPGTPRASAYCDPRPDVLLDLVDPVQLPGVGGLGIL